MLVKRAMFAAALAAACMASHAQSPERKARPEPRARGLRALIKPQKAHAPTSASQAVHAGRLGEADEKQRIRESVTGLHTPEGTDIQVGYRLEKARGWYEFKDGVLAWRDPLPRETHYLLITVQDAADKRILPGCKVTVQLSTPGGETAVSTTPLTFRWDPRFYHYGGNLPLAGQLASLTLSLQVDPPEFARTDSELGAFFTQPVSTSWSSLQAAAPEDEENASGAQAPERGSFLDGRHPPLEPTPYPGATPAPNS